MDLIEHYNRNNYFGIHNNLELTVLNEGEIEYSMLLEKKHFATPNLVHGGALAGFMDAILSVAAFTSVAAQNQRVATVEFKINYLKPILREMKIRGLGKVIKKGKRIIFVQGEIYDDENNLVATGSGSIIPIDL
ncbi:MAG TPA: hypothetical protein DCX54_13670 [Flavobacteriales bacterium]|nr:hypothetical protein [Flavobacteriales bacterium]